MTVSGKEGEERAMLMRVDLLYTLSTFILEPIRL